jgi:hypothetical protein
MIKKKSWPEKKQNLKNSWNKEEKKIKTENGTVFFTLIRNQRSSISK